MGVKYVNIYSKIKMLSPYLQYMDDLGIISEFLQTTYSSVMLINKMDPGFCHFQSNGPSQNFISFQTISSLYDLKGGPFFSGKTLILCGYSYVFSVSFFLRRLFKVLLRQLMIGVIKNVAKFHSLIIVVFTFLPIIYAHT